MRACLAVPCESETAKRLGDHKHVLVLSAELHVTELHQCIRCFYSRKQDQCTANVCTSALDASEEAPGRLFLAFCLRLISFGFFARQPGLGS